MNKLAQWSKTWTIPQALVACFSIAAITAMCIVITLRDAWLPLLHWLAQPESSALLIGIVSLSVTLYHRALGLPPTMPVQIESDAETTPVDRPKRTGGFAALDLLCWIAVVGSLAVLSILHGCGGAPVTPQQRVDYTAEFARCVANEQAIADRPATTEAQDLADLAAEEARCDAARQAIEHPAADGGV